METLDYLIIALVALIPAIALSNLGHSYSEDRDWRRRKALKGKKSSATRFWYGTSLTTICLFYLTVLAILVELLWLWIKART